ncbi:uncharacterized protein LOC123557629 [Mercenaria mercenaria]|uniref:uncharacterized protein LOC123557629 n=1 Tax=Mercenaria mercenaria TaxID=6596 RepID=UPI00234F4BEA|nr:uncharacterized protein LOC123557629 [Mercenaria mercenaria]
MGGINSKRKLPFKRSKKKKGCKVRQEQTIYMNEEPVYEEIGGGPGADDREVSNESYNNTVSSLDSAFCERKSSLSRSSSTGTVVYDEPGSSECSGTHPKFVNNTYLMNNDADCYYDDDVDDDAHTYISEVSLRETSSDGSSVKKGLAYNRCPLKKRNTPISLAEVPFMVEAFQPLLENTINVLEVIPHMPYIDAHEFVSVDDPKKAVEMLIARVKSLNEPGKWQAFLHALNLAEYEYIASLLRGETEEDHTVNRNLLKLFTPQIMNRIDPDEFIDHLFEKGVINEWDMEEVRCEKDRRGATAASFMLLHKVPRRVSNWFVVFLDVLEKCGLEDLTPQFNIPEVSLCTTEVKKPLCGDEDLHYLTPIHDNRRNFPKLPSQRPPPPPLPIRIPPTFVRDQRPEARAKTELELLKERKDSLQRRIEEKKLIRQYKLEVEALQRELEMLNSDQEDSDVEISEDTSLKQLAVDMSNGNCVSNTGTPPEDNESPEEGNDKTDVLEQPTDIDSVNVDTQEVPDNMNENNGQEDLEQKDAVQHISMLFTDMKHELKQDILAMRDHVTDAVLKSVINVISGSAKIEDNAYVTIEVGETILPSPVQLYNTSHRQTRGVLSPTSHKTQRQYSVDSAFFSDTYMYFKNPKQCYIPLSMQYV